MLFSAQVFSVLAKNETFTSTENSEIIYFDNGSYIVTTIIESPELSRATGTKTGQKTIDYYNSDDEIQWTATLKGTFNYTGSSATCTSASISHYIYDSSWKFTSETATKSGNKATGNVIVKHYFLGIATKTVEESFTLTCSATGALS